jgi:hypothetical protein
MQKKIQKKNKSKETKDLYCTQCGEKLDNFCFSDEVKDINAIKKHHEECKKTKKFKGSYCSRLFIAESLAE